MSDDVEQRLSALKTVENEVAAERQQTIAGALGSVRLSWRELLVHGLVTRHAAHFKLAMELRQLRRTAPGHDTRATRHTTRHRTTQDIVAEPKR
jgi:hypothetical protein